MSTPRQNWQELVLVAAIILVAFFLRVYRLDQVPPGLHYDEAFNAISGERILSGAERPILFQGNNAEEPMAIYADAFSFALFGATPWSLRLVSALAGTLNIAALYLLARGLFRRPWPAALAAFVLAILYWHLDFSRLGMEPIFTPLMTTLALGFLWRAQQATSSPTLVPTSVPAGGAGEARGTDNPFPKGPIIAQKSSPAGRGYGGVPLNPAITPRISRVVGNDRAKGEGGRGVRSAQTLTQVAPAPGWLWAIAGALLGATLYTYAAAYFVPVFVALYIGIEIIVDRGFWTRNRRGLGILALTAVLVFSPLGIYFAEHPGELIERPSQVSVGSFDLSTLAENCLKVAGMFFISGDTNPRSNLPGRPALDPFLAIGFVAGLAVTLRQIRQRESRWLLLSLVVMALPSVLTDFAPHFGRDIGLPPVIALLVALGFTAILQRAKGLRPAIRWLLPAGGLVLIAGLAFSLYSTARDYFVVWANDPGLFESFDVGYLTLAQSLRDRPANESAYLTPVDQNHYTVQFGLAGRDAESFDGRHALVLPPPGGSATYGIVTRDDTRSLERLSQLYPTGRTVAAFHDSTGQAYAVLYHLEGTPQITPQRRVHARLGDAVELVGWDISRDAHAVGVTVYWESIAQTTQDYTVFIHLIGGVNPRTQSPIWSQDDSRPDRGSYPTTRWQAGQIIVDDYRLAIPADAPPGDYQIELGMYTLETGARVRVTDANGAPMENNRVLLERISQP